eukprot:1793474-Rhodomonas_salina.2
MAYVSTGQRVAAAYRPKSNTRNRIPGTNCTEIACRGVGGAVPASAAGPETPARDPHVIQHVRHVGQHVRHVAQHVIQRPNPG